MPLLNKNVLLNLQRKEEPNWERIAGRLLSISIACDLKATEEKLGLTSFYHKISYMIEQGLYGAYILENYSHKEVDVIATLIDINVITYSHIVVWTYYPNVI